MGIIDTFAAETLADVFLGNEFFAEDVIFWAKGKKANRQEFFSSEGNQGAVIQDHDIEGSNEAQGDGRTLVENRGEADRKSFVVDLPISAAVSDPQNPKYPDKLKRVKDGMVMVAIRLVSVDAATKRVLFVHKDNVSTRETRRQQ